MGNPSRSGLGRALVVCGPTAAGKSEVADRFAYALTETYGAWVPALVVDSMQVYREIAVLSNQARRRRAEMVSIVSVTEEWNVARHREAVEEIVAPLWTPFVLDAGTGMYLNAIILELPLAPQAPPGIREKAKKLSAGEENPRRAARASELDLVGAPGRGSIWSAPLRHDVRVIYLRPPRETLDRHIAARSARIVRDGLEEAQGLSLLSPNPSVGDAVGVREMLGVVRGEMDVAEAEQNINTRTRRLARRQMRWFDKLMRHLPAERVRVTESLSGALGEHDIMETWMR